MTALYWTAPYWRPGSLTTGQALSVPHMGGPHYGTMMGPGPAMGHGGWVGPVGRPYMGAGPGQGLVVELDDAIRAFEEYISALGDDYALLEVMEFQNNFYAVVVERDTGMGAFELLLWKGSGRITSEPGPNMMWNLKYGMHPTYLSEYSTSVSPEQASEIALSALKGAFPGAEIELEEPIPFYGYYTMDYKLNGEMYGMLSVNAITGEVWFHTWHGGFIQEVELGPGEGEH